jgi:hypothetical protein
MQFLRLGHRKSCHVHQVFWTACSRET